MEQMEFDVRLESDRELEENVNVALDFACKQVRANSRAKQKQSFPLCLLITKE